MPGELHVDSRYQPMFRRLGIDADAVFAHGDIVAWRTLPDRQNCTLDGTTPDGAAFRWHIKRYLRSGAQHVTAEVEGHRLLVRHEIPTALLVGWGTLADGRGFVIFDDLAGFRPADKLIEAGTPFERLLEPTADLAARLHNAALHHRDLYLCHFMAKLDEAGTDVRLIDPARVRPLPRFLPRRWVVKDLAQFWYSTLRLPVSDDQRSRWLERYAGRGGLRDVGSLRRSIQRKARSIARHDAVLHRKRPERDVSISH